MNSAACSIAVAILLADARNDFGRIAARVAAGFVDGDHLAAKAEGAIVRIHDVFRERRDAALTRRIRAKKKDAWRLHW